jgi:hypothetical protein
MSGGPKRKREEDDAPPIVVHECAVEPGLYSSRRLARGDEAVEPVDVALPSGVTVLTSRQ